MFELGRIGIIGGGSWATAIAKIIEENPQPLNWYIHAPEAVEHMKKNGNNPLYLSSVEFDTKNLNLTSDINEVVVNFTMFNGVFITSSFGWYLIEKDYVTVRRIFNYLLQFIQVFKEYIVVFQNQYTFKTKFVSLLYALVM